MSCPSESGPLVIPTTVKTIAEEQYIECATITSIVIPSTVNNT